MMRTVWSFSSMVAGYALMHESIKYGPIQDLVSSRLTWIDVLGEAMAQDDRRRRASGSDAAGMGREAGLLASDHDRASSSLIASYMSSVNDRIAAYSRPSARRMTSVSALKPDARRRH